MHNDTARVAHDDRSYLQEAYTQSGSLAACPFRALESETSQSIDQDIPKGAQHETELIWPP